jgi:1-acyl-sn-glycerol-3-phosphate acyltransferase
MTARSKTPAWPTVGPVRRTIGRLFLWLTGWEAVGKLPDHEKSILIAAPHTSYWDAVFMLGCAWTLGVRPTWLTKHTLFRFPFKNFFRFLGASPVDRTARHNAVDAVIDTIKKSDRIFLMIAPAGTRRFTDHWKSGFYHVATGAKVPVVLGFLDFENKRGGVGPCFFLSGDVSADMDRFRAYYAPIQGKHPERKSTIRLLSESPPEERSAEVQAS